MDARIEIVTRTLGKTSRFCAVGNFERRAEGAAITYPIEGDLSTLELFASHAVLGRRGGNSFFADFSVGKPTVFRVSLDGKEAEISVFTHSYNLFIHEAEIFSRLVYDLNTGRSSQKFSLKIHIQVISEEQ